MDDKRHGPDETMNPFSGARADLGGRAQATDTVIIVAAIVIGLYFGRDVLVPIAIAVLLSFVLAPVTDALTRIRIGRIASVLVAVALAFALLIALGAVIGKQVAQLGENLPQYQTVIAKKLEAVRSSGFSKGVVEKAADALHGLDSTLGKASNSTPVAPQEIAATPPSDHPLMQVEVHEPAPGPVEILRSIVTALLPPLATTEIVIIFVVFILLQRRDLRDQFIGLIGSYDLHRTTKALDDAAFRLSRYFLALTEINASFGIVIAIGLTVIGVPIPSSGESWARFCGLCPILARLLLLRCPLLSPRPWIPAGPWSSKRHCSSLWSKGSWDRSSNPGFLAIRPGCPHWRSSSRLPSGH